MAEGTQKKSAPKAAATGGAKAPKAGAPAGTKAGAKTPATAAAAEGERCSVDKCKQPIRAKGLCRKHFLAWRRGDLGTKHRYKICSKEGCRKPAQFAGRCEEHRRGATVEAAAG